VTATYTIAPDGASITCHRCRLTSHNMIDVQQRYCAGCHVFHDNIFTVWVIYKNPKDFPDAWVLRGQDVMADRSLKPHAACHVASTLDLVRRGLAPGLTNIGRQPNDDAAIWECWV
jgi:hypothetical protein